MRTLPIGLDVEGRDALVLGATGEAAKKALRLLAAGARVTVLVDDTGVEPAIAERATAAELTLERRPLADADLERAWIVFANPGDAALEERLHAWAISTRRLCCVLDRPSASTFVNPAVVDVSGLTIAFASGGAAPGLLRKIREDMEALFADPRLGPFVEAVRELRASLPREGRARRMASVLRGFAIEARLVFPEWFERGDPPP